jgi:glycosyltransferase involved in cell wall biosynthesis
MIAVTIIICTYNRASDLEQTLRSLEQLQVPAELPTELIVVDNRSTDATKQVVEDCRPHSISVRYIYEPRAGKSHAVNTAFAAARGDVILMTDDDVRFPTDWIACMATPIQQGEAVAVAGGISIASHLKRPWMTRLHKEWLVDYDFTASSHVGVMIGANCGFAKTVLQKVPELDTELGPGAIGFSDDVLFSWQLQQAGIAIQSADCSVEHHFDPSRLSRKSLMDRAVREGHCTAYLNHHWLHSRTRHRAAKYLAKCVLLHFKRAVKRHECRSEEGCPEWELRLLHDISFYKRMKQESTRARNYDKHGLVRKAHAAQQ